MAVEREDCFIAVMWYMIIEMWTIRNGYIYDSISNGW